MRLNLFLTQATLYEKDIKRDLLLRAKNTNTLECYFYNELDALVDITGAELYFMVKATPSTVDASADINKKITTLPDAQNGHVDIELTSTDTTSLLGNYIYAIKMKYNGNFYTVSEGNICFQQNIITRES
jgi:hypothetical protein